MNTTTLAVERRGVQWISRVADYFELTKPRIAGLVLVTVAVSAYVARWGQPDLRVVIHTLIGTFLVAASASALNQWLERRGDALMQRTADRPLPAGRLTDAEVILFGVATVVAGGAYLALAVNGAAAAWGLATWVAYVCVYTPLKARTAYNTLIGAVAGAMPIMIGWSAVGGTLNVLADPRGAALFLLVFLWQFPHFMAIAWIYRGQYRSAGIKMLTVVDPSGRRAGWQAVLAALALLPVSFVPALVSPGAGTGLYLLAAFLLGAGQLLCAVVFFVRLNERAARLLLRASLVYLPGLLVCLVLIPLL